MNVTRIPYDLRPAYPREIPGEAVRGKLLELLGLQEIPKTVDCAIEQAEETGDGLTISRLIYPNSLGETVSGILSVPRAIPAEDLAGVICMPGTGGSAERLVHPHFKREKPGSGPLIGWGRELARRGFATLSLSIKLCEGRRGATDSQLQLKALGPYGRTHMGLGIEEALRGARILSESLSIAVDRIGLTGMSLGGNFAWYAMACAPWISTAVPIAGGLGSMAVVIHDGDIRRHGPYWFIPHMLRYFDHPEIVAACIAPRPFMMVAPTMDEDMPRQGVEKLIRAVKPLYRAAGHPERFQVYRPETNHQFRAEFFEWMVEWFKKYLTKDMVLSR